MIKILFICHGNICRSPMAEFVMKDLLIKEGMDAWVEVESASTSREAIGWDVHRETQRILEKHDISWNHRKARQIREEDINYFDYLIVMDDNNINYMKRLFKGNKQWKDKTFKLLHFCNMKRDVADPWYTGDFKASFDDISMGCAAFIEYLKKQ